MFDFLTSFAGDVLEGELELLEQEERNSDTESTQFSCGAHFYEEVEDKKDSVWVVQVIIIGTTEVLWGGDWQG